MDKSISESYLISMAIIFGAAVMSLGLSMFRSGNALVSVFVDKYAIASTDNRDVVADYQKGKVSIDALLISAYKTEGVYKVTLKDKNSNVATKSFSTYDDVMHPLAIVTRYSQVGVDSVEKEYHRGSGFEVIFTLDYTGLSSEERAELSTFLAAGGG